LIDERYAIHYGRFDTAWMAFCNDHQIDRDDENARKIWEEAYIDGAGGVLHRLGVVKLRKMDEELSDEYKEVISDMTKAELAEYLYTGVTLSLPKERLAFAKAVALSKFIDENATKLKEDPQLFSLLLFEEDVIDDR